jgi:hypothetical protein
MGSKAHQILYAWKKELRPIFQRIGRHPVGGIGSSFGSHNPWMKLGYRDYLT